MPELPEVETTRQGILPYLENKIISSIVVRNAKFRLPVNDDIHERCAGIVIKTIIRRAKYLLFTLSKGTIIVHLGMSGHLKIVPRDTLPNKHDHIDLNTSDGFTLRFCDPRRFGLFIFTENDPAIHPLLSALGPEPLSDQFNSQYLYDRLKNRKQPIKSLIMSNDIVVGVGNIYATESLFLSGIHPQTPARNISRNAYDLLTAHIKKILALAIKSGGTTLRDFYGFDGKPGYFSLSLNVYGRKNALCNICKSTIDALVIGGRTSTFCPTCQPLD